MVQVSVVLISEPPIFARLIVFTKAFNYKFLGGDQYIIVSPFEKGGSFALKVSIFSLF
jgi:hypothetical protein